MVLLSMNETTTFRWSFEEDVLAYAASGITAIGVWRQKLSDYPLARACALLQEHRLKVSHLSWVGGFTGSDGRTFRESLEDAKEAIQTAVALRCPTIVVYSGPRGGHTYSHSRRLFSDAITELIPLAAESGVTLALEPMHPGCASEWTFLTQLDDALEMIARLGRPELKLVLDLYHVGMEERLCERIPSILDKIALVQMGDLRQPPQGEQNRCRLGEGIVPLREILAVLQSDGYAGYYDIELLGMEFENVDYRDIINHAKAFFT